MLRNFGVMIFEADSQYLELHNVSFLKHILAFAVRVKALIFARQFAVYQWLLPPRHVGCF